METGYKLLQTCFLPLLVDEQIVIVVLHDDKQLWIKNIKERGRWQKGWRWGGGRSRGEGRGWWWGWRGGWGTSHY